jgi:hypothetical protein
LLGSARRQKALRVAACLYFVFHCAAITMANVSRTTELGDGLHRPFDWYVRATGLAQYWDMFTTIPRFLSMDGALVASDANGSVAEYGPMLPGLLPYRKTSRIHGMFLRLAFSDENYPGYSNRYLGAVCRAIGDRVGATPVQVGFELRTQQLRRLEDVRRDGRIAEAKTFRFGPAPCAH